MLFHQSTKKFLKTLDTQSSDYKMLPKVAKAMAANVAAGKSYVPARTKGPSHKKKQRTVINLATPGYCSAGVCVCVCMYLCVCDWGFCGS